MPRMKLTRISDLKSDSVVQSIEGDHKPPFRAPEGKVWESLPAGLSYNAFIARQQTATNSPSVFTSPEAPDKDASIFSAGVASRMGTAENMMAETIKALDLKQNAKASVAASKPDRSFADRDDRSGARGV